MCADRCFSNPNKCDNSSDYIRSTKQKTIFKDLVNQVQNQTNFIKNNGVNYNENFGLHNNCLAFAKSYDLLLDVTKGKYYTTPVEDPNWVSNESWSAGLYSVDYSANNVNVVVDTSYNAGNGNHIIFPITQPAELADISWNGLYPGVRVDPSYNIFYNECEGENYWREKLVDMSFNNTNYYSQSKQQSEKLYGMYYPANISFDICLCSIINIDISTIATNTGGNNWAVIENKTIEKCQILNIDNGIKLNISTTFTLTVKGILNNNGIITNNFDVIFATPSTINNDGGIINNNVGGIITNNFDGLINNNAGGIINNNGSITNKNDSKLTNNAGSIINNAGGIITNDNGGGTIHNNASGRINNTSGGTIINNYIIRNFSGGIIANYDGGIITNNNTFFNSGNVYNPFINVGCGVGTYTGTILINPIINACPP